LIKINQQHRDLFFTLLNQLWRLVSGPVTMLLIPLFLSPEQQGYWYLFGSLSALSIFADLGFSNIILQFSAHEFAYLHFLDSGLLDGEDSKLKRLGSFFRFVIKWISTICAVIFPVIYIIGIGFFVRDNVLAVYLMPWTLYAVGSLINFFNNSILSFIEGLNKIEIIQKYRFLVAIVNTSVAAIVLPLGGNVYALAFGILLSSLALSFFIFTRFRKLLAQLLNISRGFVHSWKKEIIPLFAKYVISFSSGYFTFQIYTPLMHYFHGPVYSGKVGITLALVMAIFNMSNIWMYTITPKMNMLISLKSWKNLDRMFLKRLLLSVGTYCFLCIGLVVFLLLFRNIWIIPDIISRFLPLELVGILLFCYFLEVFVNAWALYLRGHKKEPFCVVSIICTIWVVATTYIMGFYFSPMWFFMGFLAAHFWVIPVDYIIYKNSRMKWHEAI
jgi:O-antigen/teichoic acid export membrane protein